MEHYVVTNRRIYKDDNGDEQITDNGRLFPSSDLRFATYNGQFFSVIPELSIKINEDYNDFSYKSAENGSREFFDTVYKKMFNSDNNKDLLIYIHGFANKNEDLKKHLENLQNNYIGTNSTIDSCLLFAWTTNGKSLSIKEYWEDSHDAQFAGLALARLYKKLLEYFSYKFKKNELCKQNIHLMVHSMGHKVLKAAIEYIPTLFNVDHKLYGYCQLFKEIVLIGADVEEDIFDNGNAFSNLSMMGERIHVYTAKNDRVLQMSQKINKKRRLGQGILPSNVSHLDNINIVNVKPVTYKEWEGFRDELGHHWYHYSNKKAIKDIINVLKGDKSSLLIK